MKTSILFEDNHLLVIEKPVNVPVQEDSSGDPDLLNILKKDLKTRYNKPGNVYLGLVHRLDRPVGGAMVFAKTSKAASRLSDDIRRQAMDRRYYAVVHGTPKKQKDTLVDYLYKDRNKNQVYVVPKSHKKGKKAILDFEVLASKNGFSLLTVQLQTGRSHQIRVQLATMGHPLYGDQKYGAKVNKPGEQIALWANELTLIHPVKKERMTFTSNYPNEYPWNLWEK